MHAYACMRVCMHMCLHTHVFATPFPHPSRNNVLQMKVLSMCMYVLSMCGSHIQLGRVFQRSACACAGIISCRCYVCADACIRACRCTCACTCACAGQMHAYHARPSSSSSSLALSTLSDPPANPNLSSNLVL